MSSTSTPTRSRRRTSRPSPEWSSTARTPAGRPVGEVLGAVLVDPGVDLLPPAEQPVDLSLALSGDLLARHRPPPHHDHLVHRQLSPHVTDGEHVVQARV